MTKKRIMVIMLIVLVLLITGLYATYAIGTVANKTNTNSYDITLTNDSNTITLAPNQKKTILYQIKNTNNGKIKYGIGYTNAGNITVSASNIMDPPTGLINEKDYKFVKLWIKNNNNAEQTTILSTILGYEKGGNLIIPQGVTIVEISSEEPTN